MMHKQVSLGIKAGGLSGPSTHNPTVAVTPDNSEVAKLADIWLHPKQGPDAALAMAFGDVALNEFYFQQRTAALRQYLQLLAGQARIEGTRRGRHTGPARPALCG